MQRPNVPLLVWAAASLLGKLTSGAAGSALSSVATAAIIVWSVLEIASGKSPFRRVLGMVVLAHVTLQFFI